MMPVVVSTAMAARRFDSQKDYYAELGIDESASREDIDRAYRAAARKRHPDGGGTDEEMKSLNEAHDILSDTETRNAYDAERRPQRAAYPSSMAFDPEAASRAGTLKIPVADPDLAGLLMGVAACFGLGIPLLLLVEMQWVFFLWPLRIMSLGALVMGVLLAHSALSVKRRKMTKARPVYPRGLVLLQELVFWIVAIGVVGTLVVLLYLP
ncbi:MAG: DnaJ domain-containing protein [Acidobacteriota bacterium]